MIDPIKATIDTFVLFQDLVLRKKKVIRVRGLINDEQYHTWIEVEGKDGAFMVLDKESDKPMTKRTEYYERHNISVFQDADYGIFKSGFGYYPPDNVELLRPFLKPGVNFYIVRRYQYIIYQGDGTKRMQQDIKTVTLF